LALFLIVIPGRCPALDAQRGIAQLHHTAWTAEAGAPADVWALAQTHDGFLWLGTGSGLYRFDGVSFEKVQPQGDRLTSANVTALLVDDAGALWIGYISGEIAVFKDGRIRRVSQGLPGGSIFKILQDQQRRIWAVAHDDREGVLVELLDTGWKLIGPEQGLPRSAVTSAIVGHDGILWVTTSSGLFFTRPGPIRFENTGQKLLPDTSVAEAPDGRIWLSKTGSGPRPMPDFARGARPIFVPTATARTAAADADHIIFDHDGALWGSREGGVLRIRTAKRMSAIAPVDGALVDRFSLVDGLSSDIAAPLLEDREGDIWLGTNLGLDRFRAANVVAAQGIPVTSFGGYRIAAGPAGSVLVATSHKLFRARPDEQARVINRFTEDADFVTSQADGSIWLGRSDGLTVADARRAGRVRLPPGAEGAISTWMRDAAGALWFASPSVGIFKSVGKNWSRVVAPADLPCPAPAQIADDRSGALWLSCKGALWRLHDSKFRAFSESEGLKTGRVETIFAGSADTLVAGDFGIARYDGQVFRTLPTDQFSMFGRVSGIVQTAAGDTWLNSISGVIRVRTDRLDAAFADPKGGLPIDVFTLSDGLPGVAQQDSNQPTAIEASDGKLWFVTNHGVAWIDPNNLRRNLLPPQVAIRSVKANGVVFQPVGTLRLPKGTTNLQIDFTALSLPIPERVKFRYRLDGVDGDWVDAGPRRQAYYTNIGARTYIFSVMATNNDGIWSVNPATINIVVPPTFFQSWWFKIVILFVTALCLTLIYLVRMRFVTSSIRGRLEERLNERERIARELHDTLLQGFQGLVLRFHAAAQSIEPSQSARKLMDDALTRADSVLVEGRNSILGLRSHRGESDLSEIFAKAAEAFDAEPGTTFEVMVSGHPRALRPDILEDIVKIGEEALFNAWRHAKSENIKVNLSYGSRELRLSFSDDGVGVDQEVLTRGGRPGHFGLMGMRERAERIRAKIAVTSRPGAGTEVELVLSARDVYASRVHLPFIRRSKK
jgi:signal transduction histidine kinase/ligand-binding sensor domain-containing protein